MAAKLKNLKITSTDLVDQGANPDAYIRLFKRKENENFINEEDNTLIKKIFKVFASMFGKLSDDIEFSVKESDNIQKDVNVFNQNLEQDENIKNDITKSVILQNNERENQKEETDTMKIDKSKMTPEEQAILADFEKRYGNGEQTVPNNNITNDTAQPPQLHPEVKKALSEFEEFKKAKNTEIEELRKSLEMEKLTAVAKKYEIIGKKSDELANKLYELKKAGGTVYDDYVALLDENLNTVEKSGLFGEIGKNTSGFAGVVEKIGIAAAEVQKNANGVSNPDAVVKAWEDNPELALEYEREYMGGVK